MSPKKPILTASRVLIPAALILLLSACSTLRVRTDYAHNVNFSRFHTYSWLRVRAGNQLWADRIRQDVNLQLEAKGWHEVPSGGEATVAAFGSTREQPSLETFYNGFGPGYGGWYWYGPYWGDGYATTQVVYTPVGSLTVDIFNNQNKHLIWRGTAAQALSGTPSHNEAKLQHAVAKMFSNFPPERG